MNKIVKKALSAAGAIARSRRKPFVSAVIVAGGSSERMNGVSKQLIPIAGVPVVARSALAYEACPDVSEIVVVCRDGEESAIEALMREYNIKKFVGTAKGGKTRFDSVKSGFEKTSVKSDIVAVHDAARCLITPEQISKVIDSAKKNGAAIAAAPSVDTVKIVGDDGKIASTPDRKTLWNAQTPQVFVKAMLEVGLYYPRESGFKPTDDAMLVETLGFKVAVVDCGYENIKITTPADVSVAESIVKRRSENE
ncbi:MAG: 2-C-methyl-D-erythritol 4-phosphate cytidylyltransferase [Clostridia bacterium]|nr:2-C-methyl-D-erythritol 4-phosphate cytidylyltransferase [Clostridia bacterium]MBO4428443.1 2-C-methyl-D-erythritol 4-phosphate cytidylyltransferase [Clostridia bacterium]